MSRRNPNLIDLLKALSSDSQNGETLGDVIGYDTEPGEGCLGFIISLILSFGISWLIIRPCSFWGELGMMTLGLFLFIPILKIAVIIIKRINRKD